MTLVLWEGPESRGMGGPGGFSGGFGSGIWGQGRTQAEVAELEEARPRT